MGTIRGVKPRQTFWNKNFSINPALSDYIAHRDDVNIEHAHNRGEQNIGRYRVNGFDTDNKTIYEFNGCYFHGHRCELNDKDFNEWYSTYAWVFFMSAQCNVTAI